MEKALNIFFTSNLTANLEKLKEDSQSEWGTMTPKKMLIHLIQSSKMMHFGNNTLLIKKEYTKKAIDFLYSEKDIKRGLIIPNNLGFNFDADINENIEELKRELINSTNNMLTFFKKNTDFKAIHPFFGELNSKQWILFQRKHFTHHLSQFSLL
jgi:oxepin-CoA hydrolase/3-oxo-5,6-dehydrosuberyl-CoA semialdehyde dehydrogenase